MYLVNNELYSGRERVFSGFVLGKRTHRREYLERFGGCETRNEYILGGRRRGEKPRIRRRGVSQTRLLISRRAWSGPEIVRGKSPAHKRRFTTPSMDAQQRGPTGRKGRDGNRRVIWGELV